jgi:hypothetical protein
MSQYPEDTAAAREALMAGMSAGESSNTAGAAHLDNAGDTSMMQDAEGPSDLAADAAGDPGDAEPAVSPQPPVGAPVVEGAPDPSHALPSDARG